MDAEILTGRRWRTLCEEIIDMERAGGMTLGPFERARLMERAPESTIRLLEKARRHPDLVCANSPFQSPVGQPSAPPSSFTAVNTTNVETNLWVPGIWSPVGGNDMQAGKVYEHKSGGVFGTSSVAPTALWTPRLGQSATPSSNVSMGASTATTMIASLSAVPWFSQFTWTIRSLGMAASGATATGNGFVVIGGLTTATGVVQSIGGGIPTTVDNTAATGYILSLTWGTNAAANTATCQWISPTYSLN